MEENELEIQTTETFEDLNEVELENQEVLEEKTDE